ncbi:MAG TPA: TolC family protein [Geobacteraceae bacterium]|nr:TolC family protein [Geobacteraceae bacterium]
MCLTTSLPVWAETPQLSLPQVVDYSLRNNGELKSFREEKGIRDAGKVRAGLLPNPTLDFEASTGALTGSSDENNLSVGISQEFSLTGKRDKRLTIAERELEVYRWQLADRERGILEEVKSAFYAAILANKRTNLADRAIDLNRQLLDVTKERLAAGDIPELEMNLVKVELARSEGSRIDTAKALNQSQTRLWTFMGVPGGESPEIAGNLDTEVTMTKSLVDLKQLAHGQRPDLKALEAEKERGDAEIILAEAEGVPNLTAGLFYSHEQRTDATGAGEEKVRDDLLGIRLSMPIPLFDNNQAGVQEARAKRSSSESRLLAAKRNVEREVETAYASYLNSEKILSLYKTDIIPQLEENLKLTQEAYRLGEVGILSVIQEQKKFFEVSEGYLTALHDRRTALVKLESAVATELSGGVQ